MRFVSRFWAKTSRHLDMKHAEKIDANGMHAFRHAMSAASFVLSVIVGGTHAFGQQLLDFERLKGNWTGSGWIYFSDGHRENASCRMNVRPQGRPDKGGLDVTCTAGALGLDGRAFDIVLQGANATGSWEVPAWGVSGILIGRVASSSMIAVFRSQALGNYSGRLSFSVHGECKGLASGTRDSPLDLKRISVALRRC
jgi:hypothetical protein